MSDATPPPRTLASATVGEKFSIWRNGRYGMQKMRVEVLHFRRKDNLVDLRCITTGDVVHRPLHDKIAPV